MAEKTAPSPESAGRPAHRKRNILLLVAAVVVIGGVLVGGFGIWYLFFRPAGPAAVGSGEPAFPAQAVAAPASLDGQWQVNTSLGSINDFTTSWLGYRVQEQLASIGANTAVGRTPKVTGSLTLNGSTISALTITADLTALKSDDQNRDAELTNKGIQTGQFPTAVFTLAQPIALGSLPAEGNVVDVTATGTLNLHGVTKDVQITLHAERRGGIIAVTGSLPIVFADYNITAPTSLFALSVNDHGTMELHLLFTHV
jgi:polyisoprenoid-binding protein YceI